MLQYVITLGLAFPLIFQGILALSLLLLYGDIPIVVVPAIATLDKQGWCLGPTQTEHLIAVVVWSTSIFSQIFSIKIIFYLITFF